MSGFGFPYIARIIIKDEILIPNEIVHFKSFDYKDNTYLDIPLNMNSIENIKSDFQNFQNIFEAKSNKENLSKETNVLFDILAKLEVKSFLIESFTDFNPNYWIEDLILIIVENEMIITEETGNGVNENGYLDIDFYGYTDYKILYKNFETARNRYFRDGNTIN